jgi:hypothetical protein
MDLAAYLRETIDRELPNLSALPEERAGIPRGAGKWSPKEELGHLIDSAANNHLRFVGAAGNPQYRGPGYSQDEWVRIHGYRDMSWPDIVEFWYRYNSLLARVVDAIPTASLTNLCTVSTYAPMSLAELIEDYVVHLQHHIDLLLLRETITKYPR